MTVSSFGLTLDVQSKADQIYTSTKIVGQYTQAHCYCKKSDVIDMFNDYRKTVKKNYGIKVMKVDKTIFDRPEIKRAFQRNHETYSKNWDKQKMTDDVQRLIYRKCFPNLEEYKLCYWMPEDDAYYIMHDVFQFSGQHCIDSLKLNGY